MSPAQPRQHFTAAFLANLKHFLTNIQTQSPNMSEETNFSLLLDLNSYLNCITLLTDQ